MPLAALVSSRTARRGERIRTNGSAVCRRGDSRDEVRVLDLSLQGARLSTLRRLPEGQRIWLRLPMLEPLEAHVVWSTGSTAGCQFAVPLHPAIFEILRQSM